MVIAQVRWITKAGTMNPRDVDVPGPLVNNIVIAPKEYHWQSATIEYDPRISYNVIPPINENLLNDIAKTSLKVDEKIIARRILLELIRLFQNKQDTVLVNLGIGIPALISLVAAQENVTELIVSVLESGPWGGVALSGNDFGLAVSPSALSSIPDVFSNFEGGIIDAASLGFLQVDKKGNVNPFMLPGRIFGPGGFPVIAGGVPRIYFGGTFTAGRTEFSITNNKLNIMREGTISKFIESVFVVAFSGQQATKYGQEILYVTERAVFRLTKDGVTLEEVAPGIDVEKDVIQKMSFKPTMRGSIREMDEKIFNKSIMGLRNEIKLT
jgi:acyl CoA:acetate/3-ketoacid CoA transferase